MVAVWFSSNAFVYKVTLLYKASTTGPVTTQAVSGQVSHLDKLGYTTNLPGQFGLVRTGWQNKHQVFSSNK